MDYKNKVKIFKALSDENRLIILKLIKDNEKCACKLLEELEITQSTLSHHMKILIEANLVNFRKDGKWMHYKINKETFKVIINYLDNY